MDLNEHLTLSDKQGNTVQLPLVNLLRITMVKLMPFFLLFQQETGKTDLVSFNEWMAEKLGMKGKNVLL